MNNYKITTFDGGSYFHFLTSAKNSKEALENLLVNSTDYKNIVRKTRDLTINIVKF